MQAEAEEQAAEVARVEATTAAELYQADLDAFEEALDARDAQETADNAALASKQKRAANAQARGKPKAKVRFEGG